MIGMIRTILALFQKIENKHFDEFDIYQIDIAHIDPDLKMDSRAK